MSRSRAKDDGRWVSERLFKLLCGHPEGGGVHTIQPLDEQLHASRQSHNS